MERKTLGFLFLLLLVLAADVGVMKSAEARSRGCKTKSRKYKGPCVSDTNCGAVCRSDGFIGGDCHGLRRRCMCTSC